MNACVESFGCCFLKEGYYGVVDACFPVIKSWFFSLSLDWDEIIFVACFGVKWYIFVRVGEMVLVILDFFVGDSTPIKILSSVVASTRVEGVKLDLFFFFFEVLWSMWFEISSEG